MKIITRLFLVAFVVVGTIRLALPTARGAQSAETATILSASSFAVGNSLGYGTIGDSYGFGLVANGITDYWATSKSTTIDFVFFVFPATPVTQTITFTVTSPAGATVYTYTFSPQKMSYQGSWFSVFAKGNYGTPGIYKASVYADNALIGQIPVVFAPPSK